MTQIDKPDFSIDLLETALSIQKLAKNQKLFNSLSSKEIDAMKANANTNIAKTTRTWLNTYHEEKRQRKDIENIFNVMN